MAFRRRPMGRRRFRRRWDMQTFRDCERTVALDLETLLTCDAPQIFADYILGIGPSLSGTQMKPLASRLVTFGGGHLHVRYNGALLSNTNMPCNIVVKVVTALVVLPLLEDDLTPAYLPSLASSRSQITVATAHEGDKDEDILWWHDEQLDLFNVSCNGGPPDGNTDCYALFCDDTSNGGGNLGFYFNSAVGARYGRFTVDQHVKAKRRIRERSALFLLTQYVTNRVFDGVASTWPIQRNVYFRYAVR